MASVGTTNFAGLASGIDWNTIVDQITAIDNKQLTTLKDQQDVELKRQDAYNQLNTLLGDFQSAAQTMSSASSFYTYTASMTATNATATVDPATMLTVTADSTAGAASHSIVINNVAQAEKTLSGSAILNSAGTAVTSASTALGYTDGSTFTLQGKAASAKTVTVNSTDSIQDIVDKINALNSGGDATGVTASVLQVNSSDFRIVLTADSTGLTNGAVQLSGTALDATGALANLQLGTATRSTPQAAQDASLTVDGVAVTRESNHITDLIPGTTIDLLKGDSNTTITLDTTLDTQTLKDSINSFITAYNSVIDFINTQSSYDQKTGVGGVLAGDSLMRSIQSGMASMVLDSVSGLATDRNSLALIGVELDSTGKLQMNTTTLDGWLNSDSTAIRNLFVARGVGSNSSISYVTSDASTTTAGTYAINVTTAGTKATATGATLASGLTANQDLVVTDSVGHTASFLAASGTGFTSGQSLASIVSQMNTEFQKTYTEQHQLSTSLTVGGSPAVSTDTFSALGLGVAANDTIIIGGTDKYGSPVSSTFTVLDPATDTIGDLLTSIQVAFGQQVTASLDATGNVTITSTTGGDSNLSISLTANNEGGGTLAFGSDNTVVAGRNSMNLSASVVSNQVVIQAGTYGSVGNFTVSTTTADPLGLTAGSPYSGQDMVATIGGESATGFGQTVIASSGLPNGLGITYTGTSTGNVGSITFTLGQGGVVDKFLQTYTDPLTGLIHDAIATSDSTYTSLQTKIDTMTEQIKKNKDSLLKQFQQMEQLRNKFDALGNWLTQTTAANTAGKR